MLARLVAAAVLVTLLGCGGDVTVPPQTVPPVSTTPREVRPTQSPQFNPSLRSPVPVPSATATTAPALSLTPIRESLILRQRQTRLWEELETDGVIRDVGSYAFEFGSGRLLAISMSIEIGDRNGFLAGRSGDATYVLELNGDGMQVADGATRLMAWSDDGESFLARARSENLYLVARDGSEAELVVPGSVRGVAWRPGTNAFAYDVDGRVYLLDLDAADSPVLLAEALGTATETPDARLRGWSRDGRWLLLNLDNVANVLDVDRVEVFELGRCCSYAEWSPVDNSLLVGTFFPEGGGIGEIRVLNETDLRNAESVLSSPPITGGLRPSWSPDGTTIAFLSNDCGNDWTLHLVDRDGGDVRTPPGQSALRKYDFAWSPDGRYITYAAYTLENESDSGGEIRVIDLVVGEERTAARALRPKGASGPTMRSPVFSGDGDWILFEASGGFGACLG